MSDFLRAHGDGNPISDQLRTDAKNASEEELLVAIEVNSGQLAKRAVFRAELAHRDRERQDQILSQQKYLSDRAAELSSQAVGAARLAAWATVFAALAAAFPIVKAVID